MTVRFRVFAPKTIPAGLFNEKFVEAAKGMGKEVHADFDEVTKNWKNQPEFEEDVQDTGRAIQLTVLTSDMVFRYYDQGNGGPERIIRPVNSKVLHWVDPVEGDVFVAYVHGYEGRHAVEKIEKDWAEKAPPFFEKAMAQAVKESGQAI